MLTTEITEYLLLFLLARYAQAIRPMLDHKALRWNSPSPLSSDGLLVSS